MQHVTSQSNHPRVTLPVQETTEGACSGLTELVLPKQHLTAFPGLCVQRPEPLTLMENKVIELEDRCNALSMQNREQYYQLQQIQNTSYNGTFVWRVADVRRLQREAKFGRKAIDSPPFYTGRTGYKMCLRIYLNGDGTERGSHVSLYLVLMKGGHDALLHWPFDAQVSLRL